MKFRIRDWVPTYLLIVLLALTVATAGGTEIAAFLVLVILQVLWLAVPRAAKMVGRRVSGE